MSLFPASSLVVEGCGQRAVRPRDGIGLAWNPLALAGPAAAEQVSEAVGECTLLRTEYYYGDSTYMHANYLRSTRTSYSIYSGDETFYFLPSRVVLPISAPRCLRPPVHYHSIYKTTSLPAPVWPRHWPIGKPAMVRSSRPL